MSVKAIFFALVFSGDAHALVWPFQCMTWHQRCCFAALGDAPLEGLATFGGRGREAGAGLKKYGQRCQQSLLDAIKETPASSADRGRWRA
jgi:hypothetical protein